MSDKQREYWAIEWPNGLVKYGILEECELDAWASFYQRTGSYNIEWFEANPFGDWCDAKKAEGYKAVKLVRCEDGQ